MKACQGHQHQIRQTRRHWLGACRCFCYAASQAAPPPSGLGASSRGKEVMPAHKYPRPDRIAFDDKWPRRQWPDRTITEAPTWCSVDLRDGNQALVHPMNIPKKLLLFDHLLGLGFREIEIGFPSSSDADFDFCRHVIDKKLIPSGVRVCVATHGRLEAIDRSIAALEGGQKLLFHLMTPIDPIQTQLVYRTDQAGIRDLAVRSARDLHRQVREQLDTDDVMLEYSPSWFTRAPMELTLAVIEGVLGEWQPTDDRPAIINLPATMETMAPNLYADRVEWLHTHIPDRSRVILSLHPHNDRGTAVAATELGLMAGGQRVEGCMFGNGERAGNACLVTLACNMLSEGVDPKIDLSDLPSTVEVVEYATEVKVGARHPWGGALVFTSFSGTHQDAISKGLTAAEDGDGMWRVPYLPLDPQDLGRSYESIVRINSQSGKGGVAFLMEKEFGYVLPREMQVEFAQLVKAYTGTHEVEASVYDLWELFRQTYLVRHTPLQLLEYRVLHGEVPTGPPLPNVINGEWIGSTNGAELGPIQSVGPSGGVEPVTVVAEVILDGKRVSVRGGGNGPIDAFVQGLNTHLRQHVEVMRYYQHAIGKGSKAEAVCYVQIRGKLSEESGNVKRFGVGSDVNTNTASLKAICSAVNHLLSLEAEESADSAAKGPVEFRLPSTMTTGASQT